MLVIIILYSTSVAFSIFSKIFVSFTYFVIFNSGSLVSISTIFELAYTTSMESLNFISARLAKLSWSAIGSEDTWNVNHNLTSTGLAMLSNVFPKLNESALLKVSIPILGTITLPVFSSYKNPLSFA